ncbi:hypothetical protein [Streptomyces sp. NBC_01803]|uniref:hypothetical protein n=1 Tax=Streptomyces sp. NBC_01803 TaxID=2975946 RepID=UPI002DD9519B|nr:hypothetical protein [Streptomyces sp. NBC_01803]WSA45534.1 hypothetical protein OIE51_15805 [Streptomyces sp. NBC_01803]
MTAEDGQAAAPGEGASPEGPDPEQDPATDRESGTEDGERPAEAWAAARELRDYAPASFGGGLVAGDQHGVSGGRVAGDVVMGDKVYVRAVVGEQLHGSGEVLDADLDRLAGVFHEDGTFDEALAELRASRVVILRGDHDSGRRAAALMLLRRAGAARVRALDPDSGPAALVKEVAAADGYVVCDLPTSRSNPLRPHHLLRCQERLRKQDAYLVVTVESSAVLWDVDAVPWHRPEPGTVVAAHLRSHLGVAERDGDEVMRLLALPQVRDFLTVGGRPVAHLADFAVEVARYHRGEIGVEELERYGHETLQEQVGNWLSAPAERITLRDKAFLLALAVCDEGPYTTAAELGDRLCRGMRRVESPEHDPGLTIFSTSLTQRMDLAHADSYTESELTPWGPVRQTMSRFRDRRTAQLLLREAWTGHPAVRAPLTAWLTGLARHGDPFVRTRAAATAATLADRDFSAVMHGLVRGWASSGDYRLCIQAANALTLAAYAGTSAVHRVLREWGAGTHPQRRWTAVRAYALIGPLAPDDTLDSLEELVRRTAHSEGAERSADAGEETEENAAAGAGPRDEFGGLVEAAELLLLSTPGASVPHRFMTWCDDNHPGLRSLPRLAFLAAAVRREEPSDEPTSWPLLLRSHDDETVGSPVRHALAALWRRVLRDRHTTETAQQRLRAWVLVAARDEGAETALAGLLPHLAGADSDRDRLGYLLRTMPGEDGGPPPPVAVRLLDVLRESAAAA